jgi:hypothetical protein
MVSVPGTSPGEGGPTPMSRASLGVPVGLITTDPGQAEELVAIVGPPSHEGRLVETNCQVPLARNDIR